MSKIPLNSQILPALQVLSLLEVQKVLSEKVDLVVTMPMGNEIAYFLAYKLNATMVIWSSQQNPFRSTTMQSANLTILLTSEICLLLIGDTCILFWKLNLKNTFLNPLSRPSGFCGVSDAFGPFPRQVGLLQTDFKLLKEENDLNLQTEECKLPMYLQVETLACGLTRQFFVLGRT